MSQDVEGAGWEVGPESQAQTRERHMAGKRSRGVDRDQALRARPDTELGVLE
ncbi:hypothetical protein ACFWVU_25075 [Streptomyces sp. NPDC058686]|uniref:hypothetical protein n=1 Tax=Streptomyces sp. NPDC058686 TaxID=3346599 RepID=UPI00364D0951